MTMLARAALLSLVVALIAGFSVLKPATGEATAACPAPKKLTVTRKPGAGSATLRWRAPHGVRYRVYRDRKVIGQTLRHRMRVRVSVGVRHRFVVRPVTRGGRLMRCWGELQRRMKYVAPSTPQNLTVEGAAGANAHLTWSRSTRGDGKVTAYRVFRDGATFKQTRERSIDVPISNDRTYAFTVAAVDSHGTLSRSAAPVTIETGHHAPPAPANVIATDVSDSELTLSWSPSQPARGRVSGYRVFRDGKPLRQVAGLSTRITNLAAGSSHQFTVAAVDSAGWISAQSAPAAVSTAPPIQSTGKAYAFLLASTDRSFADFRAHYRSIGTVSPTYFDCSAEAQLTGRDDPLITGWARQRGVKVLARFNCQRSSVLNRILNEPALRSQWLDQIMERVRVSGYDGANLDFEAGFASDRAAYTSFAAELAARLHAEGKLLSIAASAKTADVQNHPRSTFFDYEALSQHADTIFVMGWGLKWRRSGPGSPDHIEWVKDVVDYVASIGRPGRFVLGMPLYGMDWPNGGGNDNPADQLEHDGVQSLIARVGATPVRDAASETWRFNYVDSTGTTHDVWYPDADTLATRIRLARDHGMGVGFWRLGNEDQRLWDNPALAPGA
jgi:spore germination protein YaaH